MSDGYDRDKDKELFKEGVNVNKEKGNRWITVKAYQYDGGEKKIRLEVRNRNIKAIGTDKEWVGQKGISSITKPEAQALIKALEKALTQI